MKEEKGVLFEDSADRVQLFNTWSFGALEAPNWKLRREV